jgi:hypothetical protein
MKTVKAKIEKAKCNEIFNMKCKWNSLQRRGTGQCIEKQHQLERIRK